MVAQSPTKKTQKPHSHSHASDRHEEKGSAHAHSHAGFFGQYAELVFSLVCGLLLGVGFAAEQLGWAPEGVSVALYGAAYLAGGFYTVREAFANIRRGKFEIDTLMLVAAAGAAILGAWAEGALLLFLFSLGHALEHFAMGRATQAIEALAKLAPQTAVVTREGKAQEVPVDQLIVGDVIVVRPNARLPADGFVIQGQSSVNQAPVTGESIPVDKQPVPDANAARTRPESVASSSRVFAGTINGSGALEIEVTRKAGDTVLARVVKMVSEAESRKSPTQRFTDRFQKFFVPAVLILAVVLLGAGLIVDEPFAASFYRSMAVLVAASPCALAIATPSAVLSGVARAAQGGVLIKGGAPLEALGAVRAIAFDKTGTLTEGSPRITDVEPLGGTTAEELLAVAVAVESVSDHPLAFAIVRDGRQRLGNRKLDPASDLKSLTGRGVRAKIGTDLVWIGKAEMFGADGVPSIGQEAKSAISSLRASGRTTMVVKKGTMDLGVIGLMDSPRVAARQVIARLRELGVGRMVMLSGDNQKVADAIAREVGLDDARGDLMPEDKVKIIGALKEEARLIAMVGDGVNDAPAMASSTVGIAMGAAGSDVALETADVALMADRLEHLPFVVGLSRYTRSIILQNLYVSLGVVALLVPATIFGLGIGPAVAVHEGSTLLVVVNALRILAYREDLP